MLNSYSAVADSIALAESLGVEYTGTSSTTYLIWTISYFFFALYESFYLYLNWKLYIAISTRMHEEADQQIQMIIKVYILFVVLYLMFIFWVGSLVTGIIGIIIGVAILAWWIWYLQ